MQMQPYCIKCMVNQATNLLIKHKVANHVADELMKDTLKILLQKYPFTPPALVGTLFHRNIRDKLGFDPFAEEKELGTQEAERIYREMDLNNSYLPEALKLAAIANAIDFGVNPEAAQADHLDELFQEELTIDHRLPLVDALEKADSVLYITDNCGEIILDRAVLHHLSHLKCEVAITARPLALLNDASMDDLFKAYMDTYARLVDLGIDTIGIDFATASFEFMEAWKKADVIISKGMGNFETLIDTPEAEGRHIFFLLKAKCPPVAERLGVELGANVIVEHAPNKKQDDI